MHTRVLNQIHILLFNPITRFQTVERMFFKVYEKISIQELNYLETE